MSGHIISLHFTSRTLKPLVIKPGAKLKAVPPVELLFTDERLERSPIAGEQTIIQQLVEILTATTGKAGISTMAEAKPTITGKGYIIHFYTQGGKFIEPSYSWKTQLTMALATKLAEFGYEFVSEASANAISSFYFVEKRSVLSEVYNMR